ncbi:MAG: hypothetical protein KGL11_06175 [Alphaproteobacteria bacterium]|nr:hypothetical protein [Alphaproteobacteria bacterium]
MPPPVQIGHCRSGTGPHAAKMTPVIDTSTMNAAAARHIGSFLDYGL